MRFEKEIEAISNLYRKRKRLQKTGKACKKRIVLGESCYINKKPHSPEQVIEFYDRNNTRIDDIEKEIDDIINTISETIYQKQLDDNPIRHGGLI